MNRFLNLSRLVAALPLAGLALAGEVRYYDSLNLDASPKLLFQTTCDTNQLVWRGDGILRCPASTAPSVPTCTSFNAKNLNTGAGPLGQVDAQAGHQILLTGACAADSLLVPLRYFLYRQTDQAPVASSSEPSFVVTAAAVTGNNSPIMYYLKAEHGGILSQDANAPSAGYKIGTATTAPALVGCSVSPNGASWVTGSTPQTFTAGCTSGTISSYQWYLNNAAVAQTTSYAPSGLAADTYYIVARVCNSDNSSCVNTASVTATVTPQTTNPTPPSGCAINPTGTVNLTVGATQAFTVSCSGGSAPTIWTWASTGGTPASGSASSLSVNFPAAGTFVVSVTPCNSAGCSGLTERQVAVNPPSGNVDFPTSCSAIDINQIAYLPSASIVDFDTSGTYLTYYTNNYLAFGKNTAVTKVFRTRGASNSSMRFSMAEFQGDISMRLLVISKSPCALPGHPDVMKYANSSQPSLNVSSGAGTGYDLAPDTVYYFTAYNFDDLAGRYRSCPDDCSAILTVTQN